MADHKTTEPHPERGCSTCGGTMVIFDPEDTEARSYACPDCGYDEDEGDV